MIINLRAVLDINSSGIKWFSIDFIVTTNENYFTYLNSRREENKSLDKTRE